MKFGLDCIPWFRRKPKKQAKPTYESYPIWWKCLAMHIRDTSNTGR